MFYRKALQAIENRLVANEILLTSTVALVLRSVTEAQRTQIISEMRWGFSVQNPEGLQQAGARLIDQIEELARVEGAGTIDGADGRGAATDEQ